MIRDLRNCSLTGKVNFLSIVEEIIVMSRQAVDKALFPRLSLLKATFSFAERCARSLLPASLELLTLNRST